MEEHVGAFFFIGDHIITNDTPISKANIYGDYKNYSSHWDLWRALLTRYPEYEYMDYDYFPRGRVIFDIKASKCILYIDPKLEDNKFISKIENRYCLIPGQYNQGYDEHYQSLQPVEDIDPDELDEDVIFAEPLDKYVKRETY